MAVAAKVMPDYEDRVVLVDAVAGDSGSEGLLERYPATYVPTSVFVDATGATVDVVVGPLDETAMRAYLDVLTAGR